MPGLHICIIDTSWGVKRYFSRTCTCAHMKTEALSKQSTHPQREALANAARRVIHCILVPRQLLGLQMIQNMSVRSPHAEGVVYMQFTRLSTAGYMVGCIQNPLVCTGQTPSLSMPACMLARLHEGDGNGVAKQHLDGRRRDGCQVEGAQLPHLCISKGNPFEWDPSSEYPKNRQIEWHAGTVPVLPGGILFRSRSVSTTAVVKRLYSSRSEATDLPLHVQKGRSLVDSWESRVHQGQHDGHVAQRLQPASGHRRHTRQRCALCLPETQDDEIFVLLVQVGQQGRTTGRAGDSVF